MITPGPIIAAARKRLQHRIHQDANGRIRMFRANGKNSVWIEKEQCAALLADFDRAITPVNKRIKWGFTLSIPVMIATLSVTHSLHLDTFVDALRPRVLSITLAVLILVWWPFLVLFDHWLGTRRANAMVEARLTQLPPAPNAPNRPKGFQTMEIIGLFLIGPGLGVDLIGSIFPQAFINTPYSGRHVDAMTLAGFAVLAYLLRQRIVWALAAVAERTMPETELPPSQLPASTPSERRANIVSRARGQSFADDGTP